MTNRIKLRYNTGDWVTGKAYNLRHQPRNVPLRRHILRTLPNFAKLHKTKLTIPQQPFNGVPLSGITRESRYWNFQKH